MSLPVGHSLAGLTIWTLAQPKGPLRPRWREALLACCVANVPDVDFSTVWLLGWPMEAHRSITHSIGFAVLAGGVLAWIRQALGWTASAWREVLLWSAVLVSHPLQDLIAFDVTVPHQGIMVGWPFTTQRWSASWSMYPVMFMDKTGWAQVGAVSVVLVSEFVVFGTLWWLARAWRARGDLRWDA